MNRICELADGFCNGRDYGLKVVVSEAVEARGHCIAKVLKTVFTDNSECDHILNNLQPLPDLQTTYSRDGN
jgi:hypothetical protein